MDKVVRTAIIAVAWVTIVWLVLHYDAQVVSINGGCPHPTGRSAE